VTFLAYALALFVLALVIFVIDIMIPSGGVLIGVTGLLILGSVYCAFLHSVTTGIWMVIATCLSMPLMFWLFLEIWPRTPMGKRLIVEPTPADEFVWSDAGEAGTATTLLNAIGVTLGEMLPSGLVQIGDKTYEAFSETGPIEKGVPVKVMRLDVGRLVVIPYRESNTETPKSQGSGLDRPAADLNIDSLEG
jgi:membrane-bound serine protease (ClpP class)